MFGALRQTSRRLATKGAERVASAESQGGQALKREARKNPELYLLLAVMTGAATLAGYFLSSKPTSSSEEAKVGMTPGTMPWQRDDEAQGKYMYHPGGNPKADPKEAPSALHATIIPNVTLPKSLHDKYNKYGKDDW